MSAGQFDDAVEDVSPSLSVYTEEAHAIVELVTETEAGTDANTQAASFIMSAFTFARTRQEATATSAEEAEGGGAENDDDEEEEEDDAVYLQMESHLLGEGSLSAHSSAPADMSSKMNLSQSVRNDIVRSERTAEKKPSHTGRDDRATTEQVLDPRTRLILFRLLSKGFLSRIDGCLSTGRGRYRLHELSRALPRQVRKRTCTTPRIRRTRNMLLRSTRHRS
jgi:hypothetical protein